MINNSCSIVLLVNVVLSVYYLTRALILADIHKETLRNTNTVRAETCIVQKYITTIWERNSRLRQKCKITKQVLTPTNVTFYNWKNLNYCKVPKCGSTFWMQVFLALNNVENIKDVFGKRRSLYHNNALIKKSTMDHFSGSDVIFHVARNPYSRLYSAYVDKIYLPGFWGVASEINKRNGKACSQSPSFEEFLKFIMKENFQDPHWQPISEICGSCNVPYNVVSKQETFNNDVQFILDHLSISRRLKKEFLTNLKKKHTENSIKEITKVMIVYAKEAPCLTFIQFCQRLWKSFKIQGYISNLLSFPLKKFRTLNFTNTTAIVKIYIKGTKKIHMTSVMKRHQRQHYLAKAYKGTSSKTIKDLKRMYKADFDLYGYSYELPKEH